MATSSASPASSDGGMLDFFHTLEKLKVRYRTLFGDQQAEERWGADFLLRLLQTDGEADGLGKPKGQAARVRCRPHVPHGDDGPRAARERRTSPQHRSVRSLPASAEAALTFALTADA